MPLTGWELALCQDGWVQEDGCPCLASNQMMLWTQGAIYLLTNLSPSTSYGYWGQITGALDSLPSLLAMFQVKLKASKGLQRAWSGLYLTFLLGRESLRVFLVTIRS